MSGALEGGGSSVDEAVLVDAVRSPMGRGRPGGALAPRDARAIPVSSGPFTSNPTPKEKMRRPAASSITALL